MIGMLLLAGLVACMTHNAVVTKTVPYRQGETEMLGFLAYDDAAKDKRPGVLVVHEWWGQNDFAKERAKALAALGYVALAVDMYGGGKTTDTPAEAARLAGALRGTPVLRERIRAARDTLASQEQVDPARLAAIGFCFGGTTCLELAYSGADVLGVVSFHGGLTVPKPGDAPKAKFLVCHGADDPLVPAAQVAAYEKAMRENRCDWQLVSYGGAVHSFTNPAATGRGMPGVAYNEAAAKRSWRAMKDFFEEIFAR